MATAVLIKHPGSGMMKKGYFGFSWTYLFFGWWVPLFRGEVSIAALHLLLTVFTLSLWQFIMAFLYNKQYMTRMLVDKGFVLADSNAKNTEARIKLGIAL
ncbi:hypothetical protein [Trinickia fusca]|uniref:DUF2628 domain-containing protein n=1 Tax=Trinickia fusca TaxID=2419777 RepID=A0A494XN07_9BURK|nr:hypothetical protein [Trinickia fusca]RKP52075.1 hypothetical protein D7S89_00490 [Trinickia fusca]